MLAAPLPPAPRDEGAATEKAYLAERDIAWIRFAVIAFNIPVYYLFVYPAGVPWLALLISVVAGAYGLYVPLLQPYRRYPILTAAMFTAITDGVLIVAWLIATGGSDSPFHLLWFVSLFAVAFRYRAGATLFATLLYAAAWLGIAVWDGGFARAPLQFSVYSVYILFAGALGGFLARETHEQVARQVTLRRANQELDLLRGVTDAMGRSQDLAEALQRIVELSCLAGDWPVGEAWVPDVDGRVLSCRVGWYEAGGQGYGEFRRSGQDAHPARGEGVVGEAWQTGEVAWSRSVPDEARVARANATQQLGIAQSVAVPVRAEGKTVAVLLFYLRVGTPRDEHIIDVVSAAAQQVGPMLERRRAEARYRTLADASMEGVLLHEDGVLLEVNPRLAQMLGYRVDELVGQSAARFVAPADLQRVAAWLQSPPQGPQEVVGVRKDGTRISLEFNAREFPHEGRMVRIAAVRDITERKRAEEAQREALSREMDVARLEEMNAFKTGLLNTTSHELNTPLTPLKLQLHILRTGGAGPLNERQERAVRILERNVDRLAGLVRDVLDVAQLQSKRLRLRREKVPLQEAMEEALEPFEPVARERGLRIESVVEAGLVLDADRARLVQVIVNLVSNAIKFTQGGSVRVGAHARPDGVEITVQDTGIGLTPEDAALLFQPFSRPHEDEVVGATGTGLGLYICKGIVEEHSGRIWVESPGRGKGSTFHVLWPVAATTGDGAGG